jgi:hypothetical protein
VSNPYIVPNDTFVFTPPIKEGMVIISKPKLLAAISHVVLSDTPHWMITGVDTDMRRDRTKFSNLAIDDAGISGGIAVVAKTGLDDMGARANLGPCPYQTVTDVDMVMKKRRWPQLFLATRLDGTFGFRILQDVFHFWGHLSTYLTNAITKMALLFPKRIKRVLFIFYRFRAANLNLSKSLFFHLFIWQNEFQSNKSGLQMYGCDAYLCS